MAFGVFTISKNGRTRLAIVLRALLIAQLVLSISMIIFCYNSSMHVLLLLKDIHKLTVLMLYILTLLQAYCMKLHYTSGLRLVTWLLHCPYWSRSERLCKVWMVVGSLVALNGLLVCAACKGSLKALMKDLSTSLNIGISQYLNEPTWKKLLDTMQVQLRCCGIEKASDWYEIPWINMDFLNEDSQVVMKLAGADGKVLPPVAPYSCCAANILAACYHDPLQQVDWQEIWLERETLAAASLHPVGCVEAVRVPLTRASIALQWFNTMVFVLQVFIMLLSQLLSTSSRDAVLRGDVTGSGCGWLLGRGAYTQKDDRVEESTSMLALARRKRRRRRRAKTPSYPYLS